MSLDTHNHGLDMKKDAPKPISPGSCLFPFFISKRKDTKETNTKQASAASGSAMSHSVGMALDRVGI